MSSSRRLLSQMTRRSATQSSMPKTSVGKPLSYTFILGFIAGIYYPRPLPTAVLLIRFRHSVHINFSWTKNSDNPLRHNKGIPYNNKQKGIYFAYAYSPPFSSACENKAASAMTTRETYPKPCYLLSCTPV